MLATNSQCSTGAGWELVLQIENTEKESKTEMGNEKNRIIYGLTGKRIISDLDYPRSPSDCLIFCHSFHEGYLHFELPKNIKKIIYFVWI